MKNDFPRAELLNRLPKAAVCAEIGVWKGGFSNRIWSSCAPKRLHLIDPWRFAPELPTRWYGGQQAKSQADMDAIHMGVASKFKDIPEIVIHRLTSVDAGKLFHDGYFDWVYVDGDHSYAEVMKDFRTWWPKIKPGGYLAGDDYAWRDEEGVTSVKRAVADFAKEMQCTVEILAGSQFIFSIRTGRS